MKRMVRLRIEVRRGAFVAMALAMTWTGLGPAWPAYAAPKINVQNAPLNREVKAATSFAHVVKKVAPSVVNIYSTRMVRERPGWLPFFDDPFFRRFFGEEFDRQMRQPRTRKAQNLGSGVIVSEDGYILTNNHVVEGADKVEVAFADGKTEYTAKVVGRDPHTEVAVLKVEAKKLPAITFADSDQLEVGDVVLAIGNPFAVGQTVTMGIVSGVGRGGFGVVDYEDFIQTDAAINPGNSGGALVDAEGRLVGINTFIVSGGSGASAGVGFAIPSNLARSVLEQIIEKGKVTRGYLGVYIQPVTPELAKEFKLPDESGALVGGVSADTPAAKAGLKEGDVVIQFNGKKVNDSRHLRLMVSQTPPGTKATLKIIRDGKERTLTATLGELPEEMAAARPSSREQPAETRVDALEGVEVTDLDASTRRQFNIPTHVRGALVTRVESGSEAYEAGLRPGDVILEIDRQPVRNADDAVELSGKVKGNRVLLRVWSKGGSRYVVVNVPREKN